MITVLIQHRLRCKVATVELYRHLFHNICIWQGAYTAPLLPSPPPLLHPQKMTSSKQWVQTGLSTYSSACCAAFLFMCGLLLALSITAHMCSSSLVFPFLSSFLPSLSLGWKKTPKPDTSCPNSKKATSKSVSRDDLWEMSFRQETFSLFSRALDS